jgi:sugar phosphate isomerase/epimerase
MRLGGPIFALWDSPDTWAAAVRCAGYRAAACPLTPDADNATVRAFEGAARDADIVIAEVGAWSNPLSPDDAIRAQALAKCKRALELAERIGARCCVNIAGSRGSKWDGPCAADLTDTTFEMIVAVVRDIIDSVKPTRTCYTLETMPWMYPDSAQSYQRLIRAIDRESFAVHFDPVNLICSPQRYFGQTALIEEFVALLGARIVACHAKDIILREQLTTHLDEVRAGLGAFDYPTLLRALDGLDHDVPLLLEHLHTEEEYRNAATHIRATAAAVGVEL